MTVCFCQYSHIKKQSKTTETGLSHTTKTVSAFRPMRQGHGPGRGKGGAPKILKVTPAYVQQKLVVSKVDGNLSVAALPDVPRPVLPPLVADPAPDLPAETEAETQAKLAMWRAGGECALPSCFRLRACA